MPWGISLRMGRRARQKRIRELVDELCRAEADMRDTAACLLELTDPGDDLHTELLRLLSALDT